MTPEKKIAQIAACDSQTLMWAFPWAMTPAKKAKKSPAQDVADMRKRAGWLLKQFEEKEIDLYIPSVVVAELLAGVDPSKHGQLSAMFSERFFCPPFDSKAAALAAKLWQYERGLSGVGGLSESERSQRRVLKADMLIVASAKVAGATDFYSHDEKCRRLAKEAGMNPFDLPKNSGRLFDDPGDDESDGSSV